MGQGPCRKRWGKIIKRFALGSLQALGKVRKSLGKVMVQGLEFRVPLGLGFRVQGPGTRA